MQTRICLKNPGPVMDTWLLVIVQDNKQEWIIEGIEIYTDEDCTQLIADDVQPNLRNYPRIVAALNAWQRETERLRRQLFDVARPVTA